MLASAPVAVNDAYTVAEDTTLITEHSPVIAIDEHFNAPPLSPLLEGAGFDIAGGVIRRVGAAGQNDRKYMRTVEADFNKVNFRYEITFTSAVTNGVGIVFIGLGHGDGSSEPSQSLNFRIHSPNTAGGYVGIGNNPGGDIVVIGNITAVGTNRARIEKDGSRVTFAIDVGYSGTFAADMSYMFADLAAVAPFLTDGDSHLFFGTANQENTFDDMSVQPLRPHDVLANDTDTNVPPLSLTARLESGPAHGTLTLDADGSFSYSPAANYFGPDSFTYKANNGTLDSNVATVSINVTPVNDAPVALSDAYTVDEDVTLTVPAATGVLRNDTDADGDPLSAQLAVGPARGQLTLSANGSFTYTPQPNYYGTDSFTYRARDGAASSALATVRITINPTPDAPMAVNDTYTVAEDTTLIAQPSPVISVDEHFSAPPLSPLLEGGGFAVASGVIRRSGSTGHNDRQYIRTVEADFNKVDFRYEITFTSVVLSEVGVIYIGLGHGDGAGVAYNEPGKSLHLRIHSPNVLGGNVGISMSPATDLVNIGNITTAGTNRARIEKNGTQITFAVDVDYNGTFAADMSYTFPDLVAVAPFLTDGGSHLFFGTANQENAFDDMLVQPLRPRHVLTNDTDASIPPLSLTARLETGPTHGTLTLNADGSFSYAPAPEYFGLDTFTYRANNGTLDSNVATVSINVTRVNDPPVAVDDAYTVAEDETLTVSRPEGLLPNDSDVDGDPLSALLVDGPTHGQVNLAPDGSFSYSPQPNYFGTDSFTYRANDGSADSALAAVTITINPMPDAPVAVGDSYDAIEDTTLIVDAPHGVLGNDTDPDADALSAVLVQGPGHGALTLEPTGAFQYLPEPEFTGLDTFQYKASDGTLESAAAIVTINVAPANDAPVALPDTYYVGQTLAVSAAAGVLANDTDVDSPPSSFSALLVSGPSAGTLALAADGSFTYAPGTAFSGSDTFTYYTSDGAADSAPAVVTIAAALRLRTENVAVVSNPLNPVDGFFDVFVELAPGFAFSAAGYEVALRIPAGSAVTLVSAEASSATHPSLFPSQPFFLASPGALRVTDALAAGAAAIQNGSGLFRVRFTVPAGMAGTAPVQFVSAFSNLADELGDPLPVRDRTGGAITVTETPAPKVAGVFVRSTQWSSEFRGQFDPQGLGYAIPAGERQLADLPWINLDQVLIRFTENVSVQQEDLSLRGVNVASYAVAGFSYDPATFTAVWTLGAPLPADKLLVQLAGEGADPVRNAAGSRLDGEWIDGTSAFPSGDGRRGGDFLFRLNVLPGNADQLGPVNIFDTVKTRNRQFTAVGDAKYSAVYDVDGSGRINIFDTIHVRNRQFTTLPEGEPQAAPQPAPVRSRSPAKVRSLKVSAVAEVFARFGSSSNGLWLSSWRENTPGRIRTFAGRPAKSDLSIL